MRLTVCTALAGILSSCGVQVPDSEACVQLKSGGAYCNRMVTDAPRRMPKHTWDRERVGTICFAPTEYQDILRFIEEVCSRNQQCVTDAKLKAKKYMEKMGYTWRLN